MGRAARAKRQAATRPISKTLERAAYWHLRTILRDAEMAAVEIQRRQETLAELAKQQRAMLTEAFGPSVDLMTVRQLIWNDEKHEITLLLASTNAQP